MKNLIYIIFCALFFGGCSLNSGGAGSGAMNFYELKRIDSGDLAQGVEKPSCAHWRIGGLEVADKIAGARISYKKSQNEIAYFVANSWVSPLEKMIGEIAYGAIYGGCSSANDKNIGEFTLSVPKNANGVEIYVLDFYYDEVSNSAVARVLVRFNNHAREIERKIAVQKGNFAEIIKAMNVALWAAFVEVGKWKL